MLINKYTRKEYTFMSKDILKELNDQLTFKDNSKSGLWAKTEVLCSNADVIYNPYGKSSFAPGSPFTKSSNMVVIGGCQYVLEKLFGFPCDQISIPTLYEMSDGGGGTGITASSTSIGRPDSTPPTETYPAPNIDGYRTIVYRPGNIVQCYGIGVTGVAENDITVYPVDYREKSIDMQKVNDDGNTVTGTMIPFRYTSETLTVDDRRKYFGKRKDDQGVTQYYLKRFETAPVIKHVWKTGEDVEEEALVSSADVWTNASGLNPVETFTEIILKITKKDIKEYFILLEQEERARLNTVALFSGEFVKDEEDDTDDGDFRDVRLFSKLCIPTEYVSLSKDLNFIYRIYTS